jgi:Na+/H+-dicarboxylate symporter
MQGGTVKIYTKIFIGLIAGAILGIVLSVTGVGDWGNYLKPFGDAFVNLIKMVVIPLVMASIILGTASLGDVRKLGRIGLKTILIYAIFIVAAVSFGLFMANTFQPGAGFSEEKTQEIIATVTADEELAGRITDAEARSQETRSVTAILLSMIPENPIRAMVEGNMLAIIVFSILFGIALTMISSEPRVSVMNVLEGVNDAMIELVRIIMTLAPYGVFAIIAAVTATLGIEFLLSLLNYAVVTLVSLVIYFTLFYGLVVMLFSGVSPIKFFKEMRSVMLFAFGTSSSNATLPENMRVCSERLGAPREIVSFTLPLGATINMDGTAIYQGISAMFIAQVFGQNLGLGEQLMIVLTASLASIGAAGVPGIGMVTLALVLDSVGLSATGIALVLGVERILDMARTVLNVTGDAAATMIVATSEGTLKPPED